MCDGAALEEARRENEGLRLGNSRVRDNYEARFVAQQAERARLRAALEEAHRFALWVIDAHRHSTPGVEPEIVKRAKALTFALSNPTATTEEEP